MVIAVDIDDVLYPFADTVIEYVHKRSGKPVTAVELFGDQEYTASGLHESDFIRLVREYHAEDANLSHSPLPGSLEHLADLAIDNDVYLVTSRLPSMKQHTEAWIQIHLGGVRLQDIIFTGNHWNGNVTETKADICRRIEADYLIEDQPRYVDLFTDHPTQAILFGDYDWNKDHSYDVRANNWREVVGLIKSRATSGV